MNKLGIEEGIIKVIDGEMYYKSHYCYWLYTQLEEMQNKIDKAIKYLEDKNNEVIGILENNKGTFVKKQFLLHILKGEEND